MLVTVHRSLLVQFTFVDSVRAHRANYITLRAGAGMICNLNVRGFRCHPLPVILAV